MMNQDEYYESAFRGDFPMAFKRKVKGKAKGSKAPPKKKRQIDGEDLYYKKLKDAEKRIAQHSASQERLFKEEVRQKVSEAARVSLADVAEALKSDVLPEIEEDNHYDRLLASLGVVDQHAEASEGDASTDEDSQDEPEEEVVPGCDEVSDDGVSDNDCDSENGDDDNLGSNDNDLSDDSLGSDDEEGDEDSEEGTENEDIIEADAQSDSGEQPRDVLKDELDLGNGDQELPEDGVDAVIDEDSEAEPGIRSRALASFDIEIPAKIAWEKGADVSVSDELRWTAGVIEEVCSVKDFKKMCKKVDLSAMGVPSKIVERVKKEKSGEVFVAMSSFKDVVFPGTSSREDNAQARRDLCLHVASHISKLRKRVLKHNLVVRKDQNAVLRDQGFTRARVLILTPFRSSAMEIVNGILACWPESKQTQGKQRFMQEFGPEDDDPPKEADLKKPEDWQELFLANGGNSSDNFRMGISLQASSVKLYAPFYQSDVIVASPLGLRLITGAEGDQKREFDFLSSLEVVALDRADALKMQNWEHVIEVLKASNIQPKDLRGADIRRLRLSSADGQSRLLRQTIVLSDGMHPEFMSVLNDRWSEGPEPRRNIRGSIQLRQQYVGSPLKFVSSLGIPKQFFLRAHADDAVSAPDAIFSAFTQKYWPNIGSGLKRLLIFVPSYFDFIRLRRWFKDEGPGEGEFCSIHEYTSQRRITHHRQLFRSGSRKVILVTERLLWYRRFRVHGAEHVLFFGPPETASIYKDQLSCVNFPSKSSCFTIFSSFDALALERIIGTDKTSTLLSDNEGMNKKKHKIVVYT